MQRIRLLARDGGARILPQAEASPHLARYGLPPQPGDGLVTADVRIGDGRWSAAAQDDRFMAGAIGEVHAKALASFFAHVRRERPDGVVLLLASSGIRLQEANAAEIAAARVLAALLDVRAAGIPVLAIAVGDLFGAAAILALACDRLALLPGTRIGLTGPQVIEALHGRQELDAGDADAVDALFGAQARSEAGIADLLADDPDAVAAWLSIASRDAVAFPIRVADEQERLAARIGALHENDPEPRWLDVDPAAGLFRLRAAGGVFGPRQAIAADAALLAADDADLARPRTLLIVEDSAGHPSTRQAESLAVAQYLAHHAAVLALLRSRGHRIVGWLAGTGHGAAFLVNGLQADELYATAHARVVALPPSAIARVTGLDRGHLDAAIEDDPLLGQPIRHFAALGAVQGICEDEASLRALL